MDKRSYYTIVASVAFLVFGILVVLFVSSKMKDSSYSTLNKSEASDWTGFAGWVNSVQTEEVIIGSKPLTYNSPYSKKDRNRYWELDYADTMGYVLTEANRVKGKSIVNNLDGFGLEYIYTLGYPCCGIRPYSDTQYVSSYIYIGAWSPNIQNDDSVIVEWSINKQDWNYITDIYDVTNPDASQGVLWWSSIRRYELPRELIQEPTQTNPKFYLRFRDTNRTSSDISPGQLYINILATEVKILPRTEN